MGHPAGPGACGDAVPGGAVPGGASASESPPARGGGRIDAAEVRSAVEDALRGFFAQRRDAVARVGPEFTEAVGILERFVLRGGKRLRPLFAWAGWVSAGGPVSGPAAAAALRMCSALELVQACALIHDDFIDSSDTRRGHPTVHVEVSEAHRSRGLNGDAAHFGSAVAVLLGDLALAWADDMLRQPDLPEGAHSRIAGIWAAMRTEVLGGQLLDLEAEARGDETVAAAMRVNRFKTAAYTVQRPLQLGAAAADGGTRISEAFARLGEDLGTAFQLRDDLLGVFGDPAVTGKPSGDDLREGKRTALFATALARADRSDPDTAALLRARIGTDLTPAQVAGLREVISELGAVDDVERMITGLAADARTALGRSGATPTGAELIESMITAATVRDL